MDLVWSSAQAQCGALSALVSAQGLRLIAGQRNAKTYYFLHRCLEDVSNTSEPSCRQVLCSGCQLSASVKLQTASF